MPPENSELQKILDGAMNRITKNQSIPVDKLSPRQKAGLIILVSVAKHLTHSFQAQLVASVMIDSIGASEWPEQPIQKSSVELLYRVMD